MADWYVYVLTSTVRAVTYVGCTNDVERRVRQHNGELSGGARFTQRWRPWELGAVYGPFDGRGDAQRAERLVKRLRGRERLSAKASALVRPLTSVNGPVPSCPRGGTVGRFDLLPVGTPLGVDPRGFHPGDKTREDSGLLSPAGDHDVIVSEPTTRGDLLRDHEPSEDDALAAVLVHAEGGEVRANCEGEGGGGHALPTERGSVP